METGTPVQPVNTSESPSKRKLGKHDIIVNKQTKIHIMNKLTFAPKPPTVEVTTLESAKTTEITFYKIDVHVFIAKALDSATTTTGKKRISTTILKLQTKQTA